MELICIDLEASGLSAESYPIEIAWVNDANGANDSFMINPDSVPGWSFWDDHAEEIHGLERCRLVKEGIDVIDAAQRLNDRLQGATLISDAPEYDSFWLKRLFDAAGLEAEFEVAGLDTLLSKEQLIQLRFLAKAQFRRHRALNDVLDIIQCIKAVVSD